MMKEEFERIAGYEVSYSDYADVIEPMYMATKLDKAEFVKTLNKRRFALRTIDSYKIELRQIAEHLKNTCEHYTDYDARDRLSDICEAIKERLSFCAGFIVNTKYTMEHLGECRGCVYPSYIQFYNKDYATILTIDLFNK